MHTRHAAGIALLAVAGLVFTACAEESAVVETSATPGSVVRPVGTDLTGIEIDVHQGLG